MVMCLLSRDSHGDTGILNHEETVRGPEIAIFPEKSEILLNRHLPLDLRLDNFPINSSASSAIHHVSVKLFKHNNNEFKLFIPRGFALSIWEILLESASQFGYEIKEN